MDSAPAWNDWKTHRGVMIRRRMLLERTPDGRPKFIYKASVGDRELASKSQAGIKVQIGRVLNHLTPCDCTICIHHRVETPISPEHCAMELDFFPIGSGSCLRFEVRP